MEKASSSWPTNGLIVVRVLSPADLEDALVLLRVPRGGRAEQALRVPGGRRRRQRGNRERHRGDQQSDHPPDASEPHPYSPSGRWSVLELTAACGDLERLRLPGRETSSTPSGMVAMCFPWPTGTLAIAGIPSGAISSSSISSTDRGRLRPLGQRVWYFKLTSVPNTKPEASSSFPDRIRWLSPVSSEIRLRVQVLDHHDAALGLLPRRESRCWRRRA